VNDLSVKQKRVALRGGSVVIGFYTAHWLVFSEASKFNKAVAIAGGLVALAALPPKERMDIAAGAAFGATTGYLTALA